VIQISANVELELFKSSTHRAASWALRYPSAWLLCH